MPELVIVFNARAELAARWAAEPFVPDDLVVCADPDATLYDALETRRVGWVQLLVGALPGGVRAAAQGRFPHATAADMQRLGADVAVRPDGTVALLHRARTADDRVAPDRLAAALAP